MSFSVVFHHRGTFVTHPSHDYLGGQVHVMHNLDLNKWSYPEVNEIVKEDLGHTGKCRFWWKPKESSLEGGLRPIRDDETAMEMANFAITNKCGVDVYVEDENRVSESPHANYIQSTMDVQKVMGLARKVITGKQPDWNVVTKEMPISPYLLQTYNIVLPLSNFARTLTGGERGKSHEDGGTKPTDPFMPPQSDGATDGVIPTQTSGTDT